MELTIAITVEVNTQDAVISSTTTIGTARAVYGALPGLRCILCPAARACDSTILLFRWGTPPCHRTRRLAFGRTRSEYRLGAFTLPPLNRAAGVPAPACLSS